MNETDSKKAESDDGDNYNDGDAAKSGCVSNGQDGNGGAEEDTVMNETDGKKAESDDGDNCDHGDEEKSVSLCESGSSSDKKGCEVQRFEPLKSSSSSIEEIDIGNMESCFQSSLVYNPFRVDS